MNYITIGDPHLGRVFKTGVPLHRVGDREAMVWRDFEAMLDNVSTELHVNMGDLFDKFLVPPEVVLKAARIYLAAAQAQPRVTFVILEGNHDRAKDGSKSSSFDLFAALVEAQGNILVVQDVPVVFGNFGFVPYHPFTPTEKLVADLPDGLDAVFGHWDIQEWGGHNVIPTALLAKKGITLAISGHDHLAREEKRHGVKIIVTGSMQPYTHAEDPDGRLYVTTGLPIEQDVTNKNVRVLLKEGETLPHDLDCLSLTAKREAKEDVVVDTSEFESLDMNQMLASALDGLSIKDELMEVFNNA